MNSEKIVEYIDQQKIICAVVLQVKKQRLRLLNEYNREINLSAGRLSHISGDSIDISAPRDSIVKSLKQISIKRRELTEQINIKELWELLHEEGEEIDLEAMTLFCFDPPLTSDHEAAVIRAFFANRLYFKFGKNKFIPYSSDQIENRQRIAKEAEQKEKLILKGAEWIKNIFKKSSRTHHDCDPEVLNILKSYYIFEKESKTAAIAKAIMAKAGIGNIDKIFDILVQAGIWTKDENIDLIRMDIASNYTDSVLKQVKNIVNSSPDFLKDPLRRDLTHIPCITIDGQSTLDYDDAISLEKEGVGYILGIHIIDVGHYIKKNDCIDKDAMSRASSIYMPDDKISMIPPELSEDFCSLKEGELRPAISTLVHLNRFFEIKSYEIVSSIIKVRNNMTYTEANMLNGENDPITTLYKIATVLREKRLKAGAVQITLPEVNIWIDSNGEIGISKVDRENSSRMLVSEIMILANSLMAEFLVNNNVTAVFRSQPDPNTRLFKGIETSLFLNCMQRRQLCRAVIGTEPGHHSGLGLKSYVTATSPIRRYYDLLTQRQIRGILGYETPYSDEELEKILQMVEIPMGNTGRIQFQRRRYWLLKYLEAMKGSVFEAIVLDSRRDFYTVLIKDYMLEWKIPASNMDLKPGDLVHVTIQHADARRNQLSLFI